MGGGWSRSQGRSGLANGQLRVRSLNHQQDEGGILAHHVAVIRPRVSGSHLADRQAHANLPVHILRRRLPVAASLHPRVQIRVTDAVIGVLDAAPSHRHCALIRAVFASDL